MQVSTCACGNTAVIASGKPFRPSTTAISTSSTPRFFSSVITRSQNLAPSVCSIHKPEDLLGAVRPHAQRDMHRLVAHRAFVAHFDPQGIEEDQRGQRLKGGPPPLRH